VAQIWWMSSSDISKPWRVADVNFIELFIESPADRQMRIEFANGVRLIIARPDHIPLAAELIETLRAGREVQP